MADPLSVLGGVAASLQLIEAAGKTCIALHSFFRAVQGAGEDMKAQIEILNGVESLLAGISSYIQQNHAATSSPLNHDVARLLKDIHGLYDYIKAIQTLIPPLPHTRVIAKARWALRRKDFDNRMRNLEGKKTSLIVNLEFLAMQDRKTLLGKGDDVVVAVRDMRSYLNDVETMTQDTALSITSLTTSVSGAQSALQRQLNGMNHDIASECRSTRSLIGKQVASIHNLQSMFASGLASSETSTSALKQGIQDIASMLPEEFSRISTRLDDLYKIAGSCGHGSCTSTTEYTFTGRQENLIARVVREEVRKVAMPIFKQLEQSRLRDESVRRSLEHAIELLSMSLWNNTTMDSDSLDDSLRIESKLPSCAGTYPLSDERTAHTNACTQAWPAETVMSFRHQKPNELLAASQERVWVYWRKISWLGNIRVEVNRERAWNKSTRQSESHVSVTMTFWPSRHLLLSRGLSLLYTTEPSSSGSHQIFPSIRTFPIIPSHSSIWGYIHQDQNDRLRCALENGLASVNDQDIVGNTLLHAAASIGNFKACQSLIEMGADTGSLNVYGASPLDIFARECWKVLFGRSYQPPQRALQILELFSSVGNDSEIFKWSLEIFSARFGFYCNHLPDLELIERFSTLLDRAGGSLSISGSLSYVIYQMDSKYTIPVLLACGMSPDGYGYACDAPIFGCMYTLWWTLLSGVGRWWEHISPGSIFAHSVDVLISAGADIHLTWNMDDEFDRGCSNDVLYTALGVDGANPFIMTPTTYAKNLGIEKYWIDALRRNGFNPDEVYAEDERRRHEFARTGGTTTSAVDLRAPQNNKSTLRPRRKPAFREVVD